MDKLKEAYSSFTYGQGSWSMDAMEKVRFMIAFQIPWNMPQLLNIDSIPNWEILI